MSDPKNLVPLSALVGAVARSSSKSCTGRLKLNSLLCCLSGGRAGVYTAATVNLVLIVYIARSWIRSGRLEWEYQARLRTFVARLWNVAVQGFEAASSMASDLGQPDEHGVYCVSSSTGSVYFRQVSQVSGCSSWEWSVDKKYWLPTASADNFWFSPDQAPSHADKLLIQRLEIESQLATAVPSSHQHSRSMAPDLPPLDLSQTTRDVDYLPGIPEPFLCPLSMSLMTEPVVTPTGATFQRSAILDWIRQHHTDPLSAQPLSSNQLYPNLVLRDMIHAWAHGVDVTAPPEEEAGAEGDAVQQLQLQQGLVQVVKEGSTRVQKHGLAVAVMAV